MHRLDLSSLIFVLIVFVSTSDVVAISTWSSSFLASGICSYTKKARFVLRLAARMNTRTSAKNIDYSAESLMEIGWSLNLHVEKLSPGFASTTKRQNRRSKKGRAGVAWQHLNQQTMVRQCKAP